MNYLDVFYSRTGFGGTTPIDKYRNEKIRQFEQNLKTAPHKVILYTDRGHFDSIIVTNKDNASKKIMEMYTRLNEDVHVGDLVHWERDSLDEKWIVYQKEVKVNEGYDTYYIVRCNYLIKWVNNGSIEQEWCYFSSSMDSKIKENFRCWHNLNSPQPNKYAEIIMPRHDITRHTTFIVEDEGWQVTETDFSSVPGIIYVSLTETKVNQIYDDLAEDIAETDRINQYSFIYPEEGFTVQLNQTLNLPIQLICNGVIKEATVNIKPRDKRYINKDLVPILVGPTSIIAEYDGYEKIIPITVAAESVIPVYLSGDNIIKLDREKTYILYGTENASFSISDTTLANIVSIDGNACVIHANDKNLIGTIILTATYNGDSYSKEITIAPLW